MNDTTNNPNSSLSDSSISQGQPAMPDATNNPDSLPYDNSNLKGQPSMSNITNDNSSLSDASNLQEQSAMSSTIDNSALSKTPQNSRSIHFCAMYTPLLSDFTNASRFAKQYSHRVRYVRDWGWFLFDGTRWHLDDSNHIFTLASASLQSYYDEAASLPKNSPPRLWERLLKHAERSQSLSRLKALLRIACTLPDLCVPHTLFDADPALLTVLNGTINLFTSELLPHNPDHFITRLIPFNYDPQAHSPVWDDFLNRLTDSTLPLQQFLQRALGYSLTGVTDHHLAFLLTGPGHHAHQLFLSLFRNLLGDYASYAPSLNHRALTPNHLTARFLTMPLSASITAHDCSTLT